jgi:hypothetical protein
MLFGLRQLDSNHEVVGPVPTTTTTTIQPSLGNNIIRLNNNIISFFLRGMKSKVPRHLFFFYFL